jgi:hypothetical protein
MKNCITHRIFFLVAIIFTFSCEEKYSSSWHPLNGPLSTRWSADVSRDNAWPEYPSPQMVKEEWLNLNGLWEYAIVGKGSLPTIFKSHTLVPFPVESSLSGVGKMVEKENILWYKREISIPRNWKKRSVILHFEAVDWETTVWIDGKEVGKHKGG